MLAADQILDALGKPLRCGEQFFIRVLLVHVGASSRKLPTTLPAADEEAIAVTYRPFVATMATSG